MSEVDEELEAAIMKHHSKIEEKFRKLLPDKVEAWFDSGNPRLRSKALSWIEKHGYDIVTSYPVDFPNDPSEGYIVAETKIIVNGETHSTHRFKVHT